MVVALLKLRKVRVSFHSHACDHPSETSPSTRVAGALLLPMQAPSHIPIMYIST